MPAPIILPRAPDTSLSNLGGVILGGVNDMADRKLAADREARLRAERLMDIQDDRAYQGGLVQDNRAYQRGLTADDRAYQGGLVQDNRAYQRGLTAEDRKYQEGLHTAARGEQLVDEKRRRENDLKTMLVKDGYLAIADFEADQAVAAAYELARRDGRLAQYKELIDAGVATVAGVVGGDEGSLMAGRQALGTQRADLAKAELARDTASRTNAQAMANKLLLDEQAVQSDLETLVGSLNQPPQMPTQNQVLSRARQLWSAANKGKVAPTDTAKLANEIAQAADELTTRAQETWMLNQQAGKQTYNVLNARLGSIDATRRSLIGAKAFGDPAVLNQAPVQQGAPQSAQPPVPAAGNRQAAAAATLRTTPPAAAATPAPGLVAPSPAPAPRSAPSAAAPARRTQFGGLLGLLERAPVGSMAEPMASPGAAGEMLGMAAKVPTTIDRGLGALGSGLLMGDFSMPERGGLGVVVDAYGNSVVNEEAQWEEHMLKNAPFSSAAYEIRRRRGLPQPSPTMR